MDEHSQFQAAGCATRIVPLTFLCGLWGAVMIGYVLVGLPILMGVAVVGVIDLLDRTRFPVRGVSPSYFAAVALLFGLFASLAATDAWQRTNKTTLALATEVSELRSLLRIAETQPQEQDTIRTAVKAYVAELRERELNMQGQGDTLAPPPPALHKLYLIGSQAKAFQGNASVNSAYLASLEAVRAARVQRLELGKNQIPVRHFAVLLLMGLLTQIAIGFSHGGNRVATAYTVMLFSLAFSAAIYFIEAFDDPYRAGYAASMSKLAEVM
jgi:hypothetical protein